MKFSLKPLFQVRKRLNNIQKRLKIMNKLEKYEKDIIQSHEYGEWTSTKELDRLKFTLIPSCLRRKIE